MNRYDAQEAMDAYQDSDPLRTGRRMVLRWGKVCLDMIHISREVCISNA